jgi:4-amino-4-deoxy-L-arabinose transferase-like glycosyltransferase
MSDLRARLAALGPWHAALALTFAVTALHLLVAGLVPLTADEAHYALYGLNPDWSYFDHPPLVGWLQALVLPFSASEFALRLWPLAFGAGTALVLYRLTLRLFPGAHPWLGFASVAIYFSGLLFQALGLVLVPETPLTFFALLTLLFLLDALERGQTRDWLLFGLCLGLAGLSKYTAVTLVPSLFVFLWFQKRLTVLRTPGPWLAVLVAAVVIAPVIYWNATHEWISFQYQLGHGFRPKDWSWARVGLSQLGQFFAYAPGIWLGGVLVLVLGFREWRERGVQLLLLTALPVFALFALASGREETLPHWTALGWLLLVPLVARALFAHATLWPVKALAWTSAVYSLVLILALHIVLLWPALPGTNGHRALLDAAYAWPDVAARAVAVRNELAATDPELRLMVPNWSLASRLAWYARSQPVQVADARFDQFDLWFGTPTAGANALLVIPHTTLKSARRVLTRFDQCRALDPLSLPRGDRPVTHYYYYRCRGYHGPDKTHAP